MSTVLQVLTVSAAFSALENDAFTINGVKTFSSVVKLPNGTAAAPSLAFGNDPDTGMYRYNTKELALAAGGAVYVTLGTTYGVVCALNGISIGSLAYTEGKHIDDQQNGGGTTTLYIGNASITVSSDERIKKNIRNTEVDAVDTLNKLRVVDFEWNDPTQTSWNNEMARVSHGGQWTGLIAQEVVKVVPHIINAPRKEDTLEIDYESENRWFVDYEHLVPMLVKAVQEMSKENIDLQNRLTALENK